MQRRWSFVLASGLVMLGCGILLFLSPRFLALYELYWGRDSIRTLLHDELGFSDAWSSFIAVVSGFVYGLAWIPLLGWTTRLLAWKFDARQLATALTCWIVVYGHSPLAHALLGSDVCFNQATGKAQKWYVVYRGGDLVLFDSSGFDPTLGEEKRPVTSEICDIHRRQKSGIRPKQITINSEDAQAIASLIRPDGRARAWYFKQSDGKIELYDAPGFHPTTRELLLPFSRAIEAEMRAEREKRETFVTNWGREEKQRLDRAFAACEQVPKDVLRVIIVPTEFVSDDISDFDIRAYVSGESGIAVIPKAMLLDGLSRRKLVFYNQRPELATHGPEIFLQVQNARSPDGFDIVQNAVQLYASAAQTTPVKRRRIKLRVMRVSIMDIMDIAKDNTEGVRYRLLAKKPKATSWDVFGANLNGGCHVLAMIVL